MKDELENCVLKGYIASCLQDHCLYWNHKLQVCTRESLKMTQAERKAWKAKQRKEIAAMADR